MPRPAAVLDRPAGKQSQDVGGAGHLPFGEAVLLALILLAAFALRFAPDLYAGNLSGVREYDDGVHYAAGLALLHGHLPYRDFVLLHPPSIALLMAPVAALGSLVGQPAAMAVARVVMIGVGLTNAAVLARLLRPVSPLAGLTAGAVYALYPGAIQTERTVMLEPLVSLCCLLAVRAVVRGRSRRAGVLLAGAVSVKLFALAYVALLVLWVCRSGGWRQTRVLGAALAGTLGSILLPFLLIAPRACWHDIVTVQMRRPLAGASAPLQRLSEMIGLTSALGHPGPAPLVLAVGGTLSAAIALLAWRRPDARIWTLLAAVTIGAFLRAPSFFPHYTAFLAPALGALAGIGLDALQRSRPGRAWVMGSLGAAALVIAGGGPVRDLHGQDDLGSVARRLVPSGSCIFTDSPSLLVAADRLRPPTRACPGWVDPRGAAISELRTPREHGFYPAGFQGVTRWQDAARDRVRRADFVLVTGTVAENQMLAPDLRAYVAATFRRAAAGRAGTHWELWIRPGSGRP